MALCFEIEEKHWMKQVGALKFSLQYSECNKKLLGELQKVQMKFSTSSSKEDKWEVKSFNFVGCNAGLQRLFSELAKNSPSFRIFIHSHNQWGYKTTKPPLSTTKNRLFDVHYFCLSIFNAWSFDLSTLTKFFYYTMHASYENVQRGRRERWRQEGKWTLSGKSEELRRSLNWRQR